MPLIVKDKEATPNIKAIKVATLNFKIWLSVVSINYFIINIISPKTWPSFLHTTIQKYVYTTYPQELYQIPGDNKGGLYIGAKLKTRYGK